MNDDLVTAAVFGDHTQAVVVRNYLEAEGIPAFLVGEWMSQGLFVVGGATGGVQIQVPGSRLEEAVQLIKKRSPEDAAIVDWSKVDVGQPEESAPIEDKGGAETNSKPPAPATLETTDEIEPTDLTLREQRASRIVRGAFIGLFAWPVLILAIWRLIQIANSKERLRPEYQRKANIGALLIGLPLLCLLLWCCLFPIIQILHLKRM